jgi:DedD protein
MAADGLKQRLVGGATLLMVAVIAWFWLLSADSPVDPVARESQIPAAPDIQPFAVQEPSAPADIEPIGSARDSQPALQSDVVPQPAVTQPIAAAKATPPPATKSTEPKASAPRASAQKPVAQQPAAALKSPPSATTKTPAAAPTATAKAEPKVALKDSGVDTAKKAGKLVPETFQLDQHGLPIAWVVQVGLFSTPASADKIKATLQEKGFKAYTVAFKSDKANGIKVFVGPKLSRERADAQKKAIDQLLKTNSMVVRFAAN